MAYFRNNTVNLLNLHYAIHAAAMTGGGAFYVIYLLKAGVPLPFVLAAMGAIVTGRFLVRPAVVPLTMRFGLRPMAILGALVNVVQYPLVAEVHGIGPALFALIAVSALGDAIYWTTYHAYFALVGDSEHRGHQISAREAVATLVGIVSPLATGWILVTFGPRAAFGATAIIQLGAALPLFFTPRVTIARDVPGAIRAAMPGVWLFVADGWTAAGFVFVWNITLFLTLKQSFVNYGGALAVAAVAGAIGGLLLGRHIDAGHGSRAVWMAYGTFAVVLLVRVFAPGHVALAIAVNALGSLVSCLYVPTLMTAVYNLAKKAPCTLRFHAATEAGWDAGCGSACFLSAILLYFGTPLWVCLLLPVCGALGGLLMLRRYYRENRIVVEQAPLDPLARDAIVNAADIAE